MVLTVQGALEHLEHAIGAPLEGIDNRRVLDEAGKKLVSLYPWNWMKRPPTTVGLTISQTYATLPTDFAEILSLERTASGVGLVQQTTFGEIQRLRAFQVAPTFELYVAPVWALSAANIPTPRLEVYPTPAATDATALTLLYRARWVDIASSDSTNVPVPDWMESIYIQLVRATAWGYQHDGTMPARVAAVIAGPEWEAARRFDNAAQWSFGPLRGGAMSEASLTDEPWPLTTPAAAPS